MGKSKLFMAMALVLSLVSFRAFSKAAGYEISSFDLSGKLAENDVLSVSETLDVDFKEPSGEFSRKIPKEIFYRSKDGVNMKYVLEVRDFKVDGFDEDLEIDDSSVFTATAKSGEAKFSGKRKFKISYDIVFPDDRIKDYDFFYYSVLSPEIGAAVKSFKFKVAFDKKIENLSEFSVVSGDRKEKSNKLNVDVDFDKSHFSGSAKDVPENTAVTVFMSLPEGYFVGGKGTFLFSLLAVVSFVSACAVAALMLLLSLFQKSEKFDAEPESEPPAGVSSAEVGFIVDSSADIDDVVSLVPYWASKGIVGIEESELDGKKKVVLKRLSDLPGDAPTYERKFFDSLFASSVSLDLSNLPERVAKGVRSSRNSLSEAFKGDRELFTDKGSVWVCLVSCVFLFLFLKLNTKVEFFGGFGGFSAVLLFVCGLLVSFGKKRLIFGGNSFIMTRLVTLLVASVSTLVTLGFTHSSDIVVPKILVIVPFALVTALDLVVSRLRRPTKYNLEVSGRLLGLKKFIAAASADSEELRAKQESDSGYFKRILPYAAVFGLADKWAAVFDSIDSSAGEPATSPSKYLRTIQACVYNPIYESYSKAYSKG